MKTKKDSIMVGIGEILWDILPGGRQLGGAPANFAYHAGQLGNRGVVISRIGKDDAGAEILQTLKAKKIEHLITEDDNAVTGSVTVTMDREGLPSYCIHEHVAWDHLQLNAAHRALARQTDAVCYGSLAQRTAGAAVAIQQFIALTPPQCHRIFDLNLRQHYYSKKNILTLLELSTILKLNEDELVEITRIFNLHGEEIELLYQLRDRYNLNYIILTKGSQGSRLFGGDGLDSQLAGYPVEVVDTVGAGDSFTAAVATGLCRGMSLSEIHPFAARVAAYVCSRSGATPELPPLQTLIGA